MPSPILLILFGPTGVGKNFVGEILRDQLGFRFYDADADLTEPMVEAIQRKEIFTEELRETYFDIVSKRTAHLRKGHKKLVVAQAFGAEQNRLDFKRMFPEATFVLITAEKSLVEQRIIKRNDWVDLEFCRTIWNSFQTPQLTHEVLDNNDDLQHIVKQLQLVLQLQQRHTAA